MVRTAALCLVACLMSACTTLSMSQAAHWRSTPLSAPIRCGSIGGYPPQSYLPENAPAGPNTRVGKVRVCLPPGYEKVFEVGGFLREFRPDGTYQADAAEVKKQGFRLIDTVFDSVTMDPVSDFRQIRLDDVTLFSRVECTGSTCNVDALVLRPDQVSPEGLPRYGPFVVQADGPASLDRAMKALNVIVATSKRRYYVPFSALD